MSTQNYATLRHGKLNSKMPLLVASIILTLLAFQSEADSESKTLQSVSAQTAKRASKIESPLSNSGQQVESLNHKFQLQKKPTTNGNL